MKDSGDTTVVGRQRGEELRNRFPKARVLVVDDVNDVRRLFALRLKQAGADVSQAADGHLACQQVAEARDTRRPFDVILMDIQMPALDGYAATRKLREAGYTGPIIAHTVCFETETREMCLQAGCDDYVTKPFHWDEFLSLVSRHLKGR